MKSFQAVLFLALQFSLLYAQGPPINTDTPIMLGLSGRGVRTFVKIIYKGTLLENGDPVTDPDNRSATIVLVPVVIPVNLFSARSQIGLVLPFKFLSREGSGETSTKQGLGDLQLFFKYLLFQSDGRNETLRLAAKASVKLPLSTEQASLQLSSGSTDYAVSVVAGWIKHRTGIYLEGIYNINGKSREISYGNGLKYNLSFAYRLFPVIYDHYPMAQLNAYLELNGMTTFESSANGIIDENSGGTTLLLSPGIQYVGGAKWLLEASLQYPVLNNPNGRQLVSDWVLSLGTRILLF